MKKCSEICVDVYGDFATFTIPYFKVERDTYPFPTPSACRGVLNAIYCKPREFYYEITKIEVMKPIKTIQMQKNELNLKAKPSGIFKEGYRINPREPGKRNNTQRITTYLVDVFYRIHANLVMQADAPPRVNLQGITEQFNRRVADGKCFFQPYLGQSGCMCYFESPDANPSMKPIPVDDDYGLVLYDVFDITKDNSEKTLDTRKKTRNDCTCVTMFHCNMVQGVINVPLWGSEGIIEV